MCCSCTSLTCLTNQICLHRKTSYKTCHIDLALLLGLSTLGGTKELFGLPEEGLGEGQPGGGDAAEGEQPGEHQMDGLESEESGGAELIEAEAEQESEEEAPHDNDLTESDEESEGEGESGKSEEGEEEDDPDWTESDGGPEGGEESEESEEEDDKAEHCKPFGTGEHLHAKDCNTDGKFTCCKCNKAFLYRNGCNHINKCAGVPFDQMKDWRLKEDGSKQFNQSRQKYPCKQEPPNSLKLAWKKKNAEDSIASGETQPTLQGGDADRTKKHTEGNSWGSSHWGTADGWGGKHGWDTGSSKQVWACDNKGGGKGCWNNGIWQWEGSWDTGASHGGSDGKGWDWRAGAGESAWGTWQDPGQPWETPQQQGHSQQNQGALPGLDYAMAGAHSAQPPLPERQITMKTAAIDYRDTKVKSTGRGTPRIFPCNKKDNVCDITDFLQWMYTKIKNKGTRAQIKGGLLMYLSLFNLPHGITLKTFFQKLQDNNLIEEALNLPVLDAELPWTDKMMQALVKACSFLRIKLSKGDTNMKHDLMVLEEEYIEQRIKMCRKCKQEITAIRDEEGLEATLNMPPAPGLKEGVLDMMVDLATAAYAKSTGKPGPWNLIATRCFTGSIYLAQCNSRPGPWEYLNKATLDNMEEKGREYWTAVVGNKNIQSRGCHGAYMCPLTIQAAKVYLSMGERPGDTIWFYKYPKLDHWLKDTMEIYFPGFSKSCPTQVRTWWTTMLHHDDDGELAVKISDANKSMNNAMNHEAGVLEVDAHITTTETTEHAIANKHNAHNDDDDAVAQRSCGYQVQFPAPGSHCKHVWLHRAQALFVARPCCV